MLSTCARNIHIRGAGIPAKRGEMQVPKHRHEAAERCIVAEAPRGSPAYKTDSEQLFNIGVVMRDAMTMLVVPGDSAWT